METDKLVVYKKDSCFKCQQVIDLLTNKGIDLETRQMEHHFDEIRDYPYFKENLYPIMKKAGEFVTLKEILKKGKEK